MQYIIDLVLTDWTGILVQLFFTYPIILMIVDQQKPPVQTCLLTGVGLIVLAAGGSFVSPIVSGISILNGILWLTVGYQRYKQK